MSVELLTIFVITLAVRLFSVTVGGGGLVLIPMLIGFGLPPSMAVATNRMGGFASVISLIPFHKKRQVRWKLGLELLPATIAGSLIGGSIVLLIDQELFRIVLGAVILLSLPFLFLKKEIGVEENRAPLSRPRRVLGHVFTFFATILGGIFASTGLWITYIGLYLKMTFLETAATRKLISTTLGVTTLTIFILNGLVDWPIAITMFAASALGAWAGASLGMRAGNVWVKRLFAAVVIITTVKILLFP